MNNEDLLNKMLNQSTQPSEVVKDILEYENRHIEKVNSSFNKFYFYFEHAFELIVNVVHKFNYISKEDYPKHRIIQFLLLKNNISPLFSAFERLKRGFYYDSLILLRACYEAIIKIYFSSYNPKDADVVLLYKTPKGRRQFNLTNFVRDHLKVDWEFIYRLLSGFSHSNNASTLSELVDLAKNGQNDVLDFKLEYDEDLLSITFNVTNFILWNYLNILLELFVQSKEDEFGDDLYNNLVITEKAFGEIIKATPNNFAKTYDDVRNIFEEIRKRKNSND